MGFFEIAFLLLAAVVVVEFAVLITILKPVKTAASVVANPSKVWIVVNGHRLEVCKSTLSAMTEAGFDYYVE